MFLTSKGRKQNEYRIYRKIKRIIIKIEKNMKAIMILAAAMMSPNPASRAHLIHPKWLRPKGRNTEMKRMAINALWSLSLIMVVFISSAKVLIIFNMWLFL